MLILCCMLTAMTAIGKTRWHHVIHLMQIPLAFVVLGCIMILLQISHHGESMLVSLHLGSWYFGITGESLHQFGQVFLQCLAAVSCLYFLSATTPMTELFTALRRLHLPAFLVEMMELVYRYIFEMCIRDRFIGDTARPANAGQSDRGYRCLLYTSVYSPVLSSER